MNYVECAKLHLPKHWEQEPNPKRKSEPCGDVKPIIVASQQAPTRSHCCDDLRKSISQISRDCCNTSSVLCPTKTFSTQVFTEVQSSNSKSWKQRAPTPMTTGAGQLVHWLVQLVHWYSARQRLEWESHQVSHGEMFPIRWKCNFFRRNFRNPIRMVISCLNGWNKSAIFREECLKFERVWHF